MNDEITKQDVLEIKAYLERIAIAVEKLAKKADDQNLSKLLTNPAVPPRR